MYGVDVAPPEQIVQELNCPRCNAVAHLRAADVGSALGTTVDGDTDVLWLVVKCPKCKLERTAGFTTKRAMQVYRRRMALVERLEGTEDEARRQKLAAVIERLDMEHGVYELGL